MNPSSNTSLTIITLPQSWQRRYRLVFAVALIGLLTGCQSTTATQVMIPLPESALLINSYANLYQVDDSLFRSQQLNATDIALLKANHIDAILNLRYFDRDDDEELLDSIINDPSLALYNQPLKSWHVTAKEIAQALTTIKQLQAQNKRVLVHCYHGADRTGLIIAMYRIIEQDWTVEEAKQEMTTGGFGYHRMWINLENMLNPDTVAAVRAQM